MVRFMYAANSLISVDTFMGLLSAPAEKVPEIITDLGFQFVFPTEPFRDDPYYVAEVEKNIDNYLMRFARSFRAQTFGPEPVFGFLFAKPAYCVRRKIFWITSGNIAKQSTGVLL
jgi:hypothetical protein